MIQFLHGILGGLRRESPEVLPSAPNAAMFLNAFPSFISLSLLVSDEQPQDEPILELCFQKMNMRWNAPVPAIKGGLRSVSERGRGRQASFREGRFGPLSSTSWNSMPKYDDWTVLSRYNHVKGLGSRMTKKRSDPGAVTFIKSYNYFYIRNSNIFF